MATPIYAARQANLQLELNQNSDLILSLVPDSPEAISSLLQLHGSRQSIKLAIEEFSVMRDNLDLKLKEMLEQENSRVSK